MNVYSVIVGLGTGQFGPFRARYQWETPRLEAVDEEDAMQQAGKLARERGETPTDFRVVRQYRWEITLRGREDKRRRETFLQWAPNEAEAIKFLSYKDGPVRFAGLSNILKGNGVVSAERSE